MRDDALRLARVGVFENARKLLFAENSMPE